MFRIIIYLLYDNILQLDSFKHKLRFGLHDFSLSVRSARFAWVLNARFEQQQYRCSRSSCIVGTLQLDIHSNAFQKVYVGRPGVAGCARIRTAIQHFFSFIFNYDYNRKIHNNHCGFIFNA